MTLARDQSQKSFYLLIHMPFLCRVKNDLMKMIIKKLSRKVISVQTTKSAERFNF